MFPPVTRDVLSQLLRVSTRTIDSLVTAGDLPSWKDATSGVRCFDVAEAVAAWTAYQVRLATRETVRAPADVEKRQAEAELKRAQADKAALELAELRGQMHRSEHVAALTGEFAVAVRTEMMTLGGEVAGRARAARSDAAAQALIDNAARGRLDTVAARYAYDPEAYAKLVSGE